MCRCVTRDMYDISVTICNARRCLGLLSRLTKYASTMTKKRSTHDTDNEDQDVNGLPVSKRARTSSGDEEEVSHALTPKRKSKRVAKDKGKAPLRDNDDDDDDDDELVDNQLEVEEEETKPPVEDDDKFDEEHEPAVRAAIEASRRRLLGVSQSR
jgi:hypothetical protein